MLLLFSKIFTALLEKILNKPEFSSLKKKAIETVETRILQHNPTILNKIIEQGFFSDQLEMSVLTGSN